MIPQGWEEKTLGKVCEIISGTTPDTSNDEFWGKGNYWITPAEINENSLYINSTARTITDKAVEYCSLRRMPRGTVLFSSRAPIGKIAISNVDSLYCNQGFKNFICSKNIHNKFLYYFLLKSRKYLISLGKGATFKEVSKSIISTVNIQYPPLPEQERIVAKLDKAFEAIDKAKIIAETNLKNAKELFESALNKAFTENTDGWEEKKLLEIGNVQTGTTPKTSETDNFGSYIPFIKPSDINQDGTLNYKNEGLSEKGLKQSRFIPKHSVLMVCIGTVGKTGYCDIDIACNQQINTLTPKTDNYKFLYYAMIRKSFQSKILLGCPQTTLPIINKTNWSLLTLKMPSLSEQQNIVRQLDKLQEQTKQLQAIYTQKIKECDELKQSILQKAFRGEL